LKSLVTIIIPVYNAEAYLSEAIHSAINQSWKNKEIIIIDDGSTDNSYLIAKQFESEQVTVLKQKNNGASAARNAGLAIAKGDFIQFLDADDFLDVHKIELQLVELISRPGSIIFGDCIHFSDSKPGDGILATHKEINHIELPRNFIKKLYGGVNGIPAGMIEIHSWLSPRSIINASGLWNESLSVDDDGEFFLRVVLASNEVLYQPHAIVYYRKHSVNSLSNNRGHTNMVSNLKSLQQKACHLSKKNRDLTFNKIISDYFWQLGVRCYPEHKDLYRICRDEALRSLSRQEIPHLNIGNKLFDLIANHLSWKLARWLQYHKQTIFKKKT
jgi:glycosyltransferase involved in cell wall biosynthesis